MDENKKQEDIIYRIRNCIWAIVDFQIFKFNCLLRNLDINDPQTAINHCNKCNCFQDTNIDMDLESPKGFMD